MTLLSTKTSKALSRYMADIGARARRAASSLRLASPESKNAALRAMAEHVRASKDDILSANARDMASGKEKGLSNAMLDRLMLDDARIDAVALGLEAIANLPDSVGTIDETWTQPNGLKFSKVRVPIGVIGMIYESRPNVTSDAGALCLKSGNACILRGGSESAHSSAALHKALIKGLDTAGLATDCIQLIATTDRAAVGHLLGGLDGCIDVIIPRGGKSLITRVQTDARVPVLAHLEGLCHTYIHSEADLDMASSLIINAKMRRTGVCGSTETLLVDSNIAKAFIPDIAGQLQDMGCEIRGCPDTFALMDQNITLASTEDFKTEHLAPILNIKIVADIDQALEHIAEYGSGHTDCIVTQDATAAARFLGQVDSAIVMHNTSTQFADGGEFGFGAEIGIATGRLHARGPVGAQHLTTYKYQVQGSGQVRP